MEKNSKNQIVTSQKTNISKFRNSLSFSSTNNHQFGYINNHNTKIGYDLDKSSSNSSSNNNSNNSEIKLDAVKYKFTLDPVDELTKVNNVIIKIEYQNCCCINQSNNLYNVFSKNKSNIKYLFRGEELMPCTDYSCCDYFQKPFCINIEHVVNIETEINTIDFAIAERNCKIPCLFCCCNHEFKIKLKANNTYYGKIVLPCSIGDTKYKIYDSNDKIKYIVETEYCQPGILCTKNCCGYLPEVIFDIYNNKNESAGTIERKPGGFEQFMHVLDCYQIIFPKDASFEDKFLLICTVFMIESEIFRDKWGSLEYCGSCDCDCGDDCCTDWGYRCCAEIFASCFRF